MTQIKTQLQQLTEYILESMAPLVKPNDIDAWQERGELFLVADDLGNGGYLMAKWKHSAVISIERFPHRKTNPYNLLGIIAAFLIDCDWDRETFDLKDPHLSIDQRSRDETLLMIDVDLVDDIELVPDPKGPIKFQDSRFRVALVPVDIAESADVQPNGAN